MSESQQVNYTNSQNINEDTNVIKTITTKLSKHNESNEKKQNLRNVTEIMIGYLKIDDVIKQKQDQINNLLYDNFKFIKKINFL